MRSDRFVVRPVNWQANRDQLHAIRRAVFVVEQHVPDELEWDELDALAYHVLAITEEGAPVGTGRITLDCQVGRMAVLSQWRRRGVGTAIMNSLIALARKEGCSNLHLHAQTHAIPFYGRFGFRARGPVFDEAGIPHRLMELTLQP